ncbi:unnamed protein product [Prunus brigantina]
MAVEPVRPEPIPPQFRAPAGGRRWAGETGDQDHRSTRAFGKLGHPVIGDQGVELVQRKESGSRHGSQQYIVRSSDAGRTLIGLTHARRIVGTNADMAGVRQKFQSNSDNPTDACNPTHRVAMPDDQDAHTSGPNGPETTEVFENSLTLLEHNIPPQLERPINWKGPMSFEQVMDLRRAQITIGHGYIMDWDSPGPSTRKPRMEECGIVIGEEPTFRNPFDTAPHLNINNSSAIPQHGISNMGLKRIAEEEWVEKGSSPKKRKKPQVVSPAILSTTLSPSPSRGGKTRSGRGRGRGRSSPMCTGRRTGGVVIREVSDQHVVNEPNQDDSLMEVSVKEYYGTDSVQNLGALTRKYRPAIVFLMETKMKDNALNAIRRRFGYRNFVHIDPVGNAGGLALWWDDGLDIQILTSSKHIIDTIVATNDGMNPHRATWVYGTPYREEKDSFWRKMNELRGDTGLPWLCAGDFNEILWSFEKSGGRDASVYQSRFLRQFMDNAGLIDLGFQGQKFTWRNNRFDGGLIQERLDRGLVSHGWQDLWPNTIALHCPSLGSDHCPVLIDSCPRNIYANKRFKFEAYWASEHDSKEVVKHNWAEAASNRSMWLDKWCLGLKWCRRGLQNWSKERFPNNKKRIDELLESLAVLQLDWEANYSQIEPAKLELAKLWSYEEKFWHQRSRVKWLRDGDSNTTFFHQSTIQRRRTNRILKLKSGDDQWMENEGDIRNTTEDHFRDLFTTGGRRDFQDAIACIREVVSPEMNETLLSPLTDDEVDQAAKQMGALKSPGPDGFQGLFYHTYWESIRKEIRGAVHDFFNGIIELDKVNDTNIVLIPKVPHPESVNQFRPISCCNFSYKVFAKVLANRLRPVLEQIISHHQSAFVPNRQIQDNVIIAHEVFHHLKLQKKAKRYEMAMKLDMSKAYDRVEWDFLEAAMFKMGFDPKWIALIIKCVSSVKFAVLINGKPGKQFRPSRGLRQGDPLSPYLFLMVSEALSSMIHDGCAAGFVQGLKISKNGPNISHIFFADDSLIFLRANPINCTNMLSILRNYCLASGQMINMEKSSCFFSANSPPDVKTSICDLLGMRNVENPGAYLGLPTMWGRSKKGALQYVKDRISGKMHGWKHLLLSQAGKEVLIKAVIQAIPAYPMSVFKFPTTFCSELDSSIGKFWWGQSMDSDKIHWLSWENMGLAKIEGGMGFRNFSEFNNALLASQGWRLLMYPNSLWAKILKDKYFPDGDVLNAKKGARASWGWSSIPGRD